jgi:alpha,alpha-trehalose-phosphate synthase [UDP-forming]
MAWTKTQLRDMIRERLADELFVVVSNREPYIHRYDGEQILCDVPPGGLTLALDPVMRACGGLWVAHGSGSADKAVVDERDHTPVPPNDPSYTLRRVWLTEKEENGYYYGFANEGLWPMCHIAYTRPTFDASDWEHYAAVNRKFADAVLEEIGDRRAFVFIQDYHLALLSRLLKRPNILTAQFWHVPWPNREVFRICPWGEQILDGLLGNDLLGFHIQYHCQNFLETVDRTLEARIDHERYEVTRGGLTTMVRPFPISVDFDEIAGHAASPPVEEEMRKLARQHRLKGQTVALGVDRIDYTKGIPERLRSIDRFLERHPEFQEKFVFVEIGVPSRTLIPTYERLNEEIDRLVNQINWKYRTLTWKPIIFIKRGVPPVTLHAWYRLADLCLVSSLHDGMNLVAKEYIACRINDDGMLVLSQFAGAARELGDALLINPYAVDEMAERVYQGLVMPREERQRRMKRLRDQVREQNIYRWAGKILSTLFKFEFQEPEAGVMNRVGDVEP